VERLGDAGPRGTMSAGTAGRLTRLACAKLSDADVLVRKAASEVVQALIACKDHDVAAATLAVVRELENTNPRAYKALQLNTVVSSTTSSTQQRPSGNEAIHDRVQGDERISLPQTVSGSEPEEDPSNHRSSRLCPTRPNSLRPPAQTERKSTDASKTYVVKKSTILGNSANKESRSAILCNDADQGQAPTLDDAVLLLSSLGIPKWEASEDEGGIRAGLKSSMWQLRKEALVHLAEFSKTEAAAAAGEGYSVNLLTVVKEHTKGFKESNFNLVKAVMDVFLSVCQVHSTLQKPLELWLCSAAVSLAIDKIADKKYLSVSHQVLLSLCIVRDPNQILSLCFKAIESVKSPLAHEEFLIVCTTFCRSFGVAVIGNGVAGMVDLALKVWHPCIVVQCDRFPPRLSH